MLVNFTIYLSPATYLVAQTVKRLPTMRETRVQSLGREDLLEKEMATHSSILPGKSHGQRSLVGYSPWSRKELGTTEQLTLLNGDRGLVHNTSSPGKSQSSSVIIEIHVCRECSLNPALCYSLFGLPFLIQQPSEVRPVLISN